MLNSEPTEMMFFFSHQCVSTTDMTSGTQNITVYSPNIVLIVYDPTISF